MNISKTNTFSLPFRYWNSGTGNSKSKVYNVDRWLVRKFLQSLGNPALRIVLWNGEEIGEAGSAAVGMQISDRAVLRRLLTNPLLHFGDDYSAGRINVEGSLASFMETVYRSMSRTHKFRSVSDAGAYRRNQPNLNSLLESRRNIHHHYDISNDFYKLWLDREMLYTCAYFSAADKTLEEAQTDKMELVCQKLRLQPGQTVVEAGCGWGALALHMARHHRVKVKAYNISQQQINYARQRAKAESLEGQVEYVEDDYRSITGKFDVFVSVGMLEHVGPDHYLELGNVIDRCLTEQGVGLIHSIGQNIARPMSPWFLKRMFPGSYPPTLREMMAIFEPLEFSVLDVENLRLHYAKTCEHWLDRFENNRERIREMFDECFVRAWRLYLSGCIANFNIGSLQLYQILFTRSTNNQIPWTRSHLTVPAVNP